MGLVFSLVLLSVAVIAVVLVSIFTFFLYRLFTKNKELGAIKKGLYFALSFFLSCALVALLFKILNVFGV